MKIPVINESINYYTLDIDSSGKYKNGFSLVGPCMVYVDYSPTYQYGGSERLEIGYVDVMDMIKDYVESGTRVSKVQLIFRIIND